MNLIVYVIVITLIGPLIGSLIGVMKKPSERFMFNMLSFAAGVMLAISFLELIPESLKLANTWIVVFGFIAGSLGMFLMDKAIPHIHPELCSQEPGKRLKKSAYYLLIGIFLHNFPEGIAIGIGGAINTKLTLTIALAIAIHDIPEAICTSAPYYYATKKRLKAFLLSLSTAVPTLIGFAISFFLFKDLPGNFLAIIIAATAGLMIYISADELIPTSCCKMTNHSTIFSLIAGVVFVLLLGLL
jgi:ZIP family zinc transporter